MKVDTYKRHLALPSAQVQRRRTETTEAAQQLGSEYNALMDSVV